jgi:hypothetical protein
MEQAHQVLPRARHCLGSHGADRGLEAGLLKDAARYPGHGFPAANYQDQITPFIVPLKTNVDGSENGRIELGGPLHMLHPSSSVSVKAVMRLRTEIVRHHCDDSFGTIWLFVVVVENGRAGSI